MIKINTDKYLRRLDDRYFNSRLSIRLKKRVTRRTVVALSVLGLIGFGFLVGFTVWLVLAPEPSTPLERILSVFFWLVLVFVTQISPLLIMSIRSAIEWPGQPFDERQQQLNINARSESHPLVLVLLGLTILTGLIMLGVKSTGLLPFTHPQYGGIPLYIGICVALFSLANHAPHLLIAWQLPDEPIDDGGLDNE
jgi:hypothetical protein